MYSTLPKIFNSPLLFLLILADLVLKGISLYKSARRDQKVWFVALLLVNSLGVLPFVYLVIHKDINFSGVGTQSVKTVKTGKRKK